VDEKPKTVYYIRTKEDPVQFMPETLSFCSEDEELMQFEIDIDNVGEEAADAGASLVFLPDMIAATDQAAEVQSAPFKHKKPVVGKPTRRRDEAADEDILKQYLNEIGKYPLLTKVDEQVLGQSILEGRIALSKLSSGETLDKEQRAECEAIVASGREAYQKFVNSNLKLVVSIAKKYTSSGVALLDLIQNGNLGLMHAVDKFDHSKGFKFSTYGTWWIRQSITRGIANTGRTIRLSINLNETILAVRNARWNLTQELGRQPTTDEIADYVSCSPEHVETALSHSEHVSSYDNTVKEGEDMEFIDIIEDKKTPQPSEVAMSGVLAEQINDALTNLTPREARAVRFRFGLDGGGPRSSIEVGKLIGLGREAARKEIQVAMRKLRSPSVKGQLRRVVED
jgi:RNA polymerase sigma factor (sigma-70 family)